MRPHRAAAALTLAAALVGCGPGEPPSSTPATGAPATAAPRVAATAGQSTAPCGRIATSHYRHVIWVWMENRSYDSVLGNAPGAPRLARYAKACGVATDYHGVRHPSLPNYIAATAGSTFGVATDCSPAQCPQDHPSLFGQVAASGRQWRGYAEGMDRRCDRASHGSYAARHNPAVYFTPISRRCRRWDVPMGGARGAFATALQQDRLRAFSFITPNLCDDGHDCRTGVADRWLGGWLDRIVASPAYADGDTAVFVTWDEGVGDNHVATVVIAPTVPAGTRSGRHFTHYSLLRTAEEMLGLPLLRHAADARSMRSAFHLG